MPFKSQAQRRKFAELLVEGKITPETYEEWNRETGSARLPERSRKTAKKKKRASKSTAKKSKKTPTKSKKATKKRSRKSRPAKKR